MNPYSDAALLKGEYAKKAMELDWNKAAPKSPAEQAAAALAQNVFALSQSIDQKTERLVVLANSHAGAMRVGALAPTDGEILRIDGVLENDNPASMIVHVSRLALTITKEPITEDEDEDDLRIGFIIFDELEKRAAERGEGDA